MFRGWICGLICLSLGSGAIGQDSGKSKPKKRGEWMIANGIGTSQIGNSKLRVKQSSSNTNLTYHDVNWKDEADQFPPVYNFRALYWPSDEASVGYGFEFVHLKFVADPEQTVRVTGTLNGSAYSQTEPMENTLQQFAITNGANFFNVVAVGRKRMNATEDFPAGRTQAYVGIGAGVVVPHPVSRFLGGTPKGAYEFDGFGWHALAGVEYRVNQKFGISLEAKYTDYSPSLKMRDGAEGSTRFRAASVFLVTTFRF